MFRRFRAAGELPYGAFGELVWETQRLEMQALAERSDGRAPAGAEHGDRSAVRRREPDRLAAAGAAGRSAALAAFAAERLPGMQLWLEHLVYCSSGGTGESRLFVRKEGEWRFPALAPAEAQAYLNELVDGYLLGMSQPLLLLPESGGAWLKACYDAERMSS